jgi:hypothetical protein
MSETLQVCWDRNNMKDILSELTLFGEVKQMPSALRQTLNFSELKLVWDDEANSWKSVGKIGVASVDDIIVNKRMNGLFELQIRRSGDICDIYLEPDRRTWYYFGYTRALYADTQLKSVSF